MNEPSMSNTRAVVGSDFPAGSFHAARRGYTLVEMVVVVTIMGVLLSMGIPRFQHSLEQSRADVAGANLRSIWSAQRLFWLENRFYADSIQTLTSHNLIDASLGTANSTYTYQVSDSSDQWFTATATRVGSPAWSGSFTIAANGTMSGSLERPGHSAPITPGFQ